MTSLVRAFDDFNRWPFGGFFTTDVSPFFTEDIFKDDSTKITEEKNDMKISFPLSKGEEIISLQKETNENEVTFTLKSKCKTNGAVSTKTSTISTTVSDEYNTNDTYHEFSDDKLSLNVFIPKKKKAVEKEQTKQLTVREKLSLVNEKINELLKNKEKSDDELVYDISSTLDNLIDKSSSNKKCCENKECCK